MSAEQKREVDQGEIDALKVFAIEMSRDPREGLTARQRALMACIVIPAPIQQWMIDAGAVEPLLDSIEKTILAAEAYAAAVGDRHEAAQPQIQREVHAYPVVTPKR